MVWPTSFPCLASCRAWWRHRTGQPGPGRIHQEARHGGGGATGIALEDLVDGGDRLAQIVEQVADAPLRPLRYPSRYITARGRIAIMSTVRLIANMNRLGVSIGSQGSAAPVSPDAQPPTRFAIRGASSQPNGERRPSPTWARLQSSTPTPRPISPAQGTRGRNAPSGVAPRRCSKASVAQGACTLKCLAKRGRLVASRPEFLLC